MSTAKDIIADLLAEIGGWEPYLVTAVRDGHPGPEREMTPDALREALIAIDPTTDGLVIRRDRPRQSATLVGETSVRAWRIRHDALDLDDHLAYLPNNVPCDHQGTSRTASAIEPCRVPYERMSERGLDDARYYARLRSEVAL